MYQWEMQRMVGKIEILPSGGALGAEIRGVDLSAEISDADFGKIRDALHEHEVLVLRNQRIEPQHQVAFARRFGPLRVLNYGFQVAGHPELYILSNVVENGQAVGTNDAGRYWHTDGAYLAKPHLFSMLYAREVPSRDGEPLGDTLFASTTKAYENLPQVTKDRIAGLHAKHSLELRYQEQRYERDDPERRHTPNVVLSSEKSSRPPAVHPLVRMHPQTGRPCLFVTEGYTSAIVELADDEARPLIAELCAHGLRPEFIYRHRWQVGDLLIWDDCSTIHRATFDYPPEARRLMHRCVVSGD